VLTEEQAGRVKAELQQLHDTAVQLTGMLQSGEYPYAYQITHGLVRYLEALSGAFALEHEQVQQENLRRLLAGITIHPD
jgi:hypothetical protein